MSESDQDKAPLLLGVSWVWTILSTIFVVLRIYTRVRYTRKLWWDDWWILFALCFAWCMSIIWTVYAHQGGTQPAGSLSPDEIVNISRLNWISQPFCIVGLVAGRISVACLIKRLQSPTPWRSALLWGLMILLVLYSSIEIILVYTQCNPSWMLWNPTGGPPDGHCLNPNVMTNNGIALAAYIVFLDLALPAITIQMIWHIRIPTRRKLAICGLLSTGIFAFAMGVVKISELSNDNNHEDVTTSTVLLFVWNACEVNAVIVAACIPALPPLIEAWTGRHPTKRGHSSNKGGGTWNGASGNRTMRSGARRGGDDVELGHTAKVLPGFGNSDGGHHERSRNDSTEEILKKGVRSDLQEDQGLRGGIQVRQQFGVA